jgi:hypothetical protein
MQEYEKALTELILYFMDTVLNLRGSQNGGICRPHELLSCCPEGIYSKKLDLLILLLLLLLLLL